MGMRWSRSIFLITTVPRFCVSSQAGCKMNCYFCATGKLGFKANLTAAQIINQILSIPPAPKPGQSPMNPLTNVVFMGMGEPLDNLTEVLKVIEILHFSVGAGMEPEENHGVDSRQAAAAGNCSTRPECM